MHVLVIGSSGMLGHVITYYLEECGVHVTDLSHRCALRKNSILVDVLNEREFSTFLEDDSYDAIINCAAILGSQCDNHPTTAIQLNAWFPHFLAEKFRYSKTKIIQISTDAVFSPGPKPYTLSDFCNPNTLYGQTKVVGELCNSKDLTIRSAFWGPDWRKSGTGLMNWFLQSRGTANGYQNVCFNGVTSLECAEFLVEAIQNNYVGIYQLAAQDNISKGDLLSQIKSEFTLPLVQVIPTVVPASTRYLSDTRPRPRKTFGEMLLVLKKWMVHHPRLYAHCLNPKI